MAKAGLEKAVETASFQTTSPCNRPLKDRPIGHPSPVNRATAPKVFDARSFGPSLALRALILLLAWLEPPPTFMSHTLMPAKAAFGNRAERAVRSAS